MRCGRIREIISAFIDSEANPLERLAMQEHVKECNPCKKELSDQYTLKSLIKSVSTPDCKADLSADIMGRINLHRPEVVSPKARPGIMMAAMAVVVLLVAAVSFRVGTEPGAPMPSNLLAESTVTEEVPEYAEYIYQHLSDDFAYVGQTDYLR